MGKIKKLFSNISTSLKETYRKFPITIIAIFLLTIVIVFGEDFLLADNVLEHLVCIGSFSIVGILFSETYSKEKKFKVLGTILSIVIAIIIDYVRKCIVINDMLFNRIQVAYVSSLILLTIYKMSKKSELEFKEYTIKVFANLFKTGIVYAILNIAIVITLSIFIVLILDNGHWNLLWKTLELLLGFYYFPAVINSFSNTTEEVGKFIKRLILYVCTPFALILISIIYIYLVKITIRGELLHNAIFFILALIFATAFPLVVMLKNYEDNKVIKCITKAITYLYIPCIFLEIYAMNIRVADYGLTKSRYMAYMLIIFEVIFIGLLIFKNSKNLSKSILAFMVLILIGTITPLNVNSVTNISQLKRMQKYLSKVSSFEELSSEDKDECYYIYVYFKIEDNIEYLEEKIENNLLDEIVNYKKDYSFYDSTEYIYCSEEINELDISEYSKMYKFEDEYGYSEECNDYSKYKVTNNLKTIHLEIDIEKFIQKMVEAKKDYYMDEHDVFRKNNILNTNKKEYVILLTNFSTRYVPNTKEIEYLRIDGYILEK